MSAIPTINGERVYANYTPDLARSNGPYDVIIIGSGMGGLACGAALARYGRKVLILEQHYVPGGFTHMFARKGFNWDAGVHAIGEMGAQQVPGKMLRWLTGSQVEMVSLGNPYDRFRFHDGFEFALPDSRDAWVASLKQEFPEQLPAIERYLEAVDEASRAAMLFFAFKSLPESVEAVGDVALEGLTKLGALPFSRNPMRWWDLTTAEVLDECGVKGKLRTVLTLHWGYYGSLPHESSFPVHALTHTHFWGGAYYPKGGSKEFAAHMLDAVRRAGGQALVRAEVQELLLEGDRCVGVSMVDGTVLRAPTVISAAGAKTTVRRLVPGFLRDSEWGRTIAGIDDSPPYICLNMGFEGDIRTAGAESANLWFFETWDQDSGLWDLTDPAARAPILYCSFPSLKDPLHDPGPKQRHTGECITFVDWDLFEGWADSELKQRPDGYQELKQQIEQRLLAHLRDRAPKLMDMLVYHELSSPISTEHFTRASRGAIYGLAATPQRFTCRKLRSRTPLPGFYMTGIDIASLGVVGAMTAGMLTAASLDPRVYRHLL